MSVFCDPEKIKEILKKLGEDKVAEEYSNIVEESNVKKEIPGFYISHQQKNDNIASLINSWATTRSIMELKKKYPSKSDIEKIEAEYKKINSVSSFPSLGVRASSGRTLRYPQYLQLRECLDDDIQTILSSSLFIEVGGPSMNICNYDALLMHLNILTRCVEHYSFIQSLDLSRSGYISNTDLKKYIEHFSKELSFIKAEDDEELTQRYIEFAAQQILIVLDPLSSGKVMIGKLLNDVLFMYFVMVDGWAEERPNPFSIDTLNSFLKDFKNIDQNHDGILDPDDLLYMSRTRLTKTFVRRAAEAISFNNGVLNFEWYVRFRVAWFSVGEDFANAYFFDTIDVDNDGYITQNEINYFYRDVDKEAHEIYPDPDKIPPYNSVVTQHLDMCQATDQKITRKMFISSKATEGLLRRICDIREFLTYELDFDCPYRNIPIPDVHSL